MRQAAQLYGGKPVNFDHADQPGGARRFGDRAGWVESAFYDADRKGVYGDVGVLLEKENGRALLEIARRRPSVIGMSHDVEAEVQEIDGVMEVTDVISVTSVDAVDRPATTKTLFESEVPKVKLSEYVQAVDKKSDFHTLLNEAVKVTGDVEVEKGADPTKLILRLLTERKVVRDTKDKKDPGANSDLVGKVDKLLEWMDKTERNQMATSILENNAIEPRPELVKELVEKEDAKAMQECVDDWPDQLKESKVRPLIQLQSAEKQDDGDFTYAAQMKRLGVEVS